MADQYPNSSSASPSPTISTTSPASNHNSFVAPHLPHLPHPPPPNPSRSPTTTTTQISSKNPSSSPPPSAVIFSPTSSPPASFPHFFTNSLPLHRSSPTFESIHLHTPQSQHLQPYPLLLPVSRQGRQVQAQRIQSPFHDQEKIHFS